MNAYCNHSHTLNSNIYVNNEVVNVSGLNMYSLVSPHRGPNASFLVKDGKLSLCDNFGTYVYDEDKDEWISTNYSFYFHHSPVLFEDKIYHIDKLYSHAAFYLYCDKVRVTTNIASRSLYGLFTLIYNNELYVFSAEKAFIKSGNAFSYTKLTSSIYPYYGVVYDGDIHIFGGDKHGILNGTSIEVVDELPVSFSMGNKALVFNDEIHIFKGFEHYKWNGTTWTKLNDFLLNQTNTDSIITFNNEIWVMGNEGHFIEKYGTNSSIKEVKVS